MISNVVKYLGLILIVLFSTISIFFSLQEREGVGLESEGRYYYTSFFEDRFYDIRMKQTLKDDAFEPRVVLVAIDDASINNIGRWPLPRDNYARLMEKLKVFGAKVIAYDVFFSEESLTCPGITPDEDMAKAIIDFQEKPGNRVILPYSLSPYPGDTFEEVPDNMYDFIMDTKQAPGLNLRPAFMEKKVFPYKTFLSSNAALAHIQASADRDGIFRHYPLVGNVDELYFPSFSLMTYQLFTGDNYRLDLSSINESSLRLKTGKLYLNYKGETKVRWFGNEGAFPKVSFWDVLQAPDTDSKMKQVFDGNIVFIGSTAYGAHDLRHTPVDSQMPGVYMHMNMVKMLLDGNFFIDTYKSTFASWIMLGVGTLLILIIQFFGHALLDLAAVVIISLGAYLFDTYYLLPQGYEIKLFFCLFSVIACYSWNTFLHFYLANKDKQFLKQAFGNYISPELIDEMYSTGEPPKLGGDSGVRTAYFTDIQSFSTFSEKLTATQLVELLNEYLTVMTDLLLEEKGTLDKYEGDAIIAFFGAPMPLEDHAKRACLVAHRMQEALLKLREKWVSEGDKWPEIVHEMRMRIGINSGEIVTGNMGSASRMNYTMMGDAVNLAARLEESAKQFGIFTQVARETKDLAGDEFIWRELDTVRVMGKTVPVQSFELIGIKETSEEYLFDLANKFDYGVKLYKEQNFTEAIDVFTDTLELEYKRFPKLKGVKTNPSEIYIQRCKDFLEIPPPPEWDGVTTLTSK
ncbi:adenylate/guanylate cyclase domain-containing protein [Bacteriovoracaceae bacterium]|nr:adenylate/guanylate cyclase domain-containing protein [Bacteriovoracaceae bacterium]